MRGGAPERRGDGHGDRRGGDREGHREQGSLYVLVIARVVVLSVGRWEGSAPGCRRERAVGGSGSGAHLLPGPRRPTGGSGPRSRRTAPSRSAARFEIGRSKRPRRLIVTTEGTRARSPSGRRSRSVPKGMWGRTSALTARRPRRAEDDARPQGDGEGRAADREGEARVAPRAVGRPDDPDVGAPLLEDAHRHGQPGVLRPGVQHAPAAAEDLDVVVGRVGAGPPAQGGALPRQPVGRLGADEAAEGLRAARPSRAAIAGTARGRTAASIGGSGVSASGGGSCSTPTPSSGGVPRPPGPGQGQRRRLDVGARSPHEAVAGGGAGAAHGGPRGARGTPRPRRDAVGRQGGQRLRDRPAQQRPGHVDVDVGRGGGGQRERGGASGCGDEKDGTAHRVLLRGRAPRRGATHPCLRSVLGGGSPEIARSAGALHSARGKAVRHHPAPPRAGCRRGSPSC